MTLNEEYEAIRKNCKNLPSEFDLSTKKNQIIRYISNYVRINHTDEIYGVYLGPVTKVHGSRLVNWPLGNGKSIIFIDEEYFKLHKDICYFQITHEMLHGLFNNINGVSYAFGYLNDLNYNYIGINEAVTQMIAEDIEGARLDKNTDPLFELKNIMRVFKVLYGYRTILSQYVNNTLDFKNIFDRVNGIGKFDTLVGYMNIMYNIGLKIRRNESTPDEESRYNIIKGQLIKFIRNNIEDFSKNNPNIKQKIIEEINDYYFLDELQLNNRTNRR